METTIRTINELIYIAHERYLNALNLWRYMQQDEFQYAYQLANDEERKQLEIKNLEVYHLVQWSRAIFRKHKQYSHLDLASLREIARDLGILNYNKFRRDILIGIISNGKNQYHENGDPASIERVCDGPQSSGAVTIGD